MPEWSPPQGMIVIDEATDLPPDTWERVAAMPQRTPSAPVMPGQPTPEEAHQMMPDERDQRRGPPTPREDPPEQQPDPRLTDLASRIDALNERMDAIDDIASRWQRNWAIEQAVKASIPGTSHTQVIEAAEALLAWTRQPEAPAPEQG